MSATSTRTSTRSFTVVFLVVAAVVAGVVSFYASGHPDGLEHVAGTTGFLSSATDHATASWPLADYTVRGIGDARLSGGLAGLLGCVVTFVVALGATRWVSRSR